MRTHRTKKTHPHESEGAGDSPTYRHVLFCVLASLSHAKKNCHLICHIMMYMFFLGDVDVCNQPTWRLLKQGQFPLIFSNAESYPICGCKAGSSLKVGFHQNLKWHETCSFMFLPHTLAVLAACFQHSILSSTNPSKCVANCGVQDCLKRLRVSWSLAISKS